MLLYNSQAECLKNHARYLTRGCVSRLFLLNRSCTIPRSGAPAAQARTQAKAPAQPPTDTIQRANHRELSDSYLIWADLPGTSLTDSMSFPFAAYKARAL